MRLVWFNKVDDEFFYLLKRDRQKEQPLGTSKFERPGLNVQFEVARPKKLAVYMMQIGLS